MLYLNSAFPIRSNPQREISRIIIGQRRNRYRTEYMLRLPPRFFGQEQLEPGFYRDLAIRRDNGDGPLYIEESDGNTLFLILTSRLAADEGFVGNIRVPRSQRAAILGRATAPRGSAGHWETLVLKARKGDAFYINWNQPNGSDALTELYYISGRYSVRSCAQNSIPDLFRDLCVTPPFTVRDNPDQFVSRLDRREWRKL